MLLLTAEASISINQRVAGHPAVTVTGLMGYDCHCDTWLQLEMRILAHTASATCSALGIIAQHSVL